MKLSREQNNTDETEEGDGQKGAAVDSGIEDIGDVRLCHGRFDQITQTFVHAVHDVYADQKKGGNLNDRLDGDRKHEPALMFGRIVMPGAEENRKRCQHDRYDQIHIADR
ncbi:MAG: hypothetical protein WAL20_12860, partial [Rhodomicrobium sp.]